MARRVLKGLMKRKIVKRGLIALLIGVLIAGLFAGGIVPLNIGQPPLGFQTEREMLIFHHYEGNGGLNNDQLLDSLRYITGATQESGEKVVTAGQFHHIGLSFQCVTGMRYVYYFSTGGSWPDTPLRVWETSSTQAGIIEGWLLVKTDVAGSMLPAESGYLRAELQLEVNNFLCPAEGQPGDLGWGAVARDHAYIRRGDAHAEFDRDQYQVGETASVTIAVGWSRSTKQGETSTDRGWAYTIHSQAQGTTVQSGTIDGPDANDADGIVTRNVFYTVQPADFVSGGCFAGANNKLQIFLTNNLVLTEEDAATTIDQRDLGPPAPVITLDKTSYFIGDSLTIQFTAVPNPTTGEPICGMHLRIYYELGNVDLHNADFSGRAAEYTINALPDDGLIIIEVDTWDEASRTSTFGKAFITVQDPEGEFEPVDIFWIVLLMVVLAILSFVIWLPMIPIPPAAKLWISILAWAVIMGLVIYFFIVPVVVSFFRTIFPFLGG